jgi:hypothetical protein
MIKEVYPKLQPVSRVRLIKVKATKTLPASGSQAQTAYQIAINLGGFFDTSHRAVLIGLVRLSHFAWSDDYGRYLAQSRRQRRRVGEVGRALRYRRASE